MARQRVLIAVAGVVIGLAAGACQDDSNCSKGEEGCECRDDAPQCDDGLFCEGGTCESPSTDSGGW